MTPSFPSNGVSGHAGAIHNYDELQFWFAVDKAPEPEWERRRAAWTPEEAEEFSKRVRNHR